MSCPNPAPAALDLDAVSWRDGILHPVSVQVQPGRVLGVLGPNGAGKSTLLRLVYRYHRPRTGRVLIDGADIHAMPQRQVVGHVAAVLQEQPTDFSLTLAEITGIVLTLASFANATSADRLVLTGVAVSFIVMSLANALIFLGDPRASHTVVFWMPGGLGLAQWSYLLFPAVVLLGAGVWLRSVAPSLNAMTIGDESATTLGIPVARFRLAVFVAGALVTGVMVAYSGVIGFVGLMIPHIVRLLVGGDAARVVPVSMLAGAVFLIRADIAARTLIRPEDIPIGVITGLVGGAFFIWLLRHRSGWM